MARRTTTAGKAGKRQRNAKSRQVLYRSTALREQLRERTRELAEALEQQTASSEVSLGTTLASALGLRMDLPRSALSVLKGASTMRLLERFPMSPLGFATKLNLGKS